MALAYQYLTQKSDSTEMVIAGRRLRVYTPKRAYEMGESAESLAADHDLPLAAGFEALAYAYQQMRWKLSALPMKWPRGNRSM